MLSSQQPPRQPLSLAEIQQKIDQEILLKLERDRRLRHNGIISTIKRKIYLYLSLCFETPEYNLLWLIQQIKKLSQTVELGLQSWIVNNLQTPLENILKAHHRYYELRESKPIIVRYPTVGEQVIIEPQYTRFLQLELVNVLEEIKSTLIKEKPPAYETMIEAIEAKLESIEPASADSANSFAQMKLLKNELTSFLDTNCSFLQRGSLGNLLIPPITTAIEKLNNLIKNGLNTSFAILSRKTLEWLQRQNSKKTGYTPTQLFLREIQSAGSSYKFNDMAMPDAITENIVFGNAVISPVKDSRTGAHANSENVISPAKNAVADLNANSKDTVEAIENKAAQIRGFLQQQFSANQSLITHIMTHLHQDAMLSIGNQLVMVCHVLLGLKQTKNMFTGQTGTVAINRIADNELAVLITTNATVINQENLNTNMATIIVKYQLRDSGSGGISYMNPQVEFFGPAKDVCHELFLQALLCNSEALNHQLDEQEAQERKRYSLPPSLPSSPTRHPQTPIDGSGSQPPESTPASPGGSAKSPTVAELKAQEAAAKSGGAGARRIRQPNFAEAATNPTEASSPGLGVDEGQESYPRYYDVAGFRKKQVKEDDLNCTF